jgi:hypothetical protein
VDIKITTALIGLAVILAAFVLSWAAEGAAPRRMYWIKPFTELEGAVQDFQAHLATRDELTAQPVSVPVLYPDRTAPGITTTMHQGFATSGYQQVAALPAAGVMPW